MHNLLYSFLTSWVEIFRHCDKIIFFMREKKSNSFWHYLQLTVFLSLKPINKIPTVFRAKHLKSNKSVLLLSMVVKWMFSPTSLNVLDSVDRLGLFLFSHLSAWAWAIIWSSGLCLF